MMRMLRALPNGIRATEALLAKYGPDRLWQVEQLGPHIFRAWIKDGEVALAIVTEDGSVQIRELEAVV